MSYYRYPSSVDSRDTQNLSYYTSERSPHIPTETRRMKTLFLEFDTLLTLKLSDGLAETRLGKPNLKRDTRRAMDKVMEHPRFKDLKYGGEFNYSFEDVWANLEDEVDGCRNDDVRLTRLAQAETVHKDQKRLRDTELDGVNCLSNGEMVQGW